MSVELPRQYAPIWETLKRDLEVSITQPRPLHKRTIKAVTKEKWMDIAYKLKIEPRRAVLSHVRNGSKITFRLTLSLIAEDF